MTLPINDASAAGQASASPPLRMSLINDIGERIRRPFLAGMAILLIAGLGSYFALQRYRLTSLEVAYSDQVMVQLNDLLANLDQAEAAERAFLTSSGNPLVARDPALAAAIGQNLARLERAAENGELATHDFGALAAQVNGRLNFFDQLSRVRLNQGEAAATAMYTAGVPNGLVSVIHDRVRELSAAQERKLAAHMVSEHLFSRLLGGIVVAGCLLAFASIAFAGYFVDGALRLITNHLTEDARGREALATLNLTLEERINERSAAAAECARDLERVRKETHAQDQLLTALIDFAGEGVLVCDTHMRLRRGNGAAERLLGEGFGRQSLDHLPLSFEMIDSASGQPVEASHWPLAQAVAGSAVRLDFQLRNRQTGEVHLVESQSTPVRDENGTVRAAIGIVRDVTPAVKGRQAVALLETIAASSDDAIITLRRDGKVSAWNPGAVRMFGYTPDEIIGHASRRIVSEGARAITREVSQRMLEGGAPESFEIEALGKDGSPVPVRVEAFPLSRTLDQDAAFMLICRNLSDRQSLENEAHGARAEMLEAGRLRCEFLINLSHDLRNTLNRIAGVIPPLLESPLSAGQRDQVRTIGSSAESLLRTVSDILDLASLAAGQAEFEQSEFDLFEVVEGALDVAAEGGQSRDLELVLTMGPDLPRRVIGDRHRVAQALATLVDSSIIFNDHGEVVVSVDCEQRGENFTTLRFELRGTGAGTPPELQARLFQPFLASDSLIDRKLGGRGLNLAIAAQLVERMGGGTITIGGEPGDSSVVRFMLRFANASGDISDSRPRVDMAGRRILVVDDNATSRVSVCGQLAQWGLAPDSAIGGAEALVTMRQRAAANASYGLVLIDMRMPGMDGFALARAIKSDPRLNAARLVMMGPYGVPEQPDTDGWLVKPVKPTCLLDCLTRLVAAPRGGPDRPRGDTGGRELSQAAANGHAGAAPGAFNGNGSPAAHAMAAANSHPSLDRSMLNALRALSGGNGETMVGALIKSLTDNLPARMAELERAAAASDLTAMQTHAATLQSLASSLGLTRMGALCAGLAADSQPDPRAATALIDSLHEEVARLGTLLADEADGTAKPEKPPGAAAAEAAGVPSRGTPEGA